MPRWITLPYPSLKASRIASRWGTPDTICDALADALSRALCRKYRRRFDNILHHNVDKALMLGDEPRADS